MTTWHNAERVQPRIWDCGFCGNRVSSVVGYYDQQSKGTGQSVIRLCSHCDLPTFFSGSTTVPGERTSRDVPNLPSDIAGLYDEARRCVGVGAFNGSVLLCRKALLHIAHDKSGTQHKNFKECVEYLEQEGYIPRDGQPWVDYIRDKGNEANHQIVHMSADDANRLLTFVEMLLRNMYELPKLVPPPPTT